MVLHPIDTPIESLPVVGALLCGQTGLLGRTRMPPMGGHAFRAPQASRCDTNGECAAPRQSAGWPLRLAALRAGTSPLSLRAEIPRGFGGRPPSAGSGFRRPRFGRGRIGRGRAFFPLGRVVNTPWTRLGAPKNRLERGQVRHAFAGPLQSPRFLRLSPQSYTRQDTHFVAHLGHKPRLPAKRRARSACLWRLEGGRT